MALSSALHATSRQRIGKHRPTLEAALWAAFISFTVAWPWVSPGYLFGTDWPGPRRFDFPTALSSSAPLQGGLAALSWATGAEWAAKLFIIGVLFASGLTAFLAAPAEGFVARASASAIYLLNPFVYGRLFYGQWYLLAGYAAMPWALARLRLLLNQPSLKTAVISAVSLTLVGFLSLHLFVVMAVVAFLLVVAYWLNNKERGATVARSASYLALTGVLTLAASSFWIVPIFLGQGVEGTKIAGIGQGDLYAFDTVPDQQLGLVPNILGLYGFWAEDTGRFTSMKAFAPIWPAVLAAILVMAAAGAIYGLRRPGHLRALVIALIGAALLGVALEMGVSNPATAGVVSWLDAHFAPYRGMRDAAKWAALIAMVYSQLAALGVAATLARIKERVRSRQRADWLTAVAIALFLAAPTYYGNGLLFGMHGEIKPSAYPAGWYAADRLLTTDPNPGRTLFLPWHEYMQYSFVRNQTPVIAPPAPSFFSVPIVVSADPEVPGIVAPDSPDQRAVTGLVRDGPRADWSGVLAGRDVKYVLLAREVDWRSYAFLDNQVGLKKIADFGSIELYRNAAVS